MVKVNDIIVLKKEMGGLEIGMEFIITDSNNVEFKLKGNLGHGTISVDEIDEYFDIKKVETVEKWSKWKFIKFIKHECIEYQAYYRIKNNRTQVKIVGNNLKFFGDCTCLDTDEYSSDRGIYIAKVKALQQMLSYELRQVYSDDKREIETTKIDKPKVNTRCEKANKFKVGDKVVPLDKTVYASFEQWKYVNNYVARFFNRNGYIVINKINEGLFTCGDDDDLDYGDFFNKSDLIPYIEETKDYDFKVGDKVVIKSLSTGDLSFKKWGNNKKGKFPTSDFFKENGYLYICLIDDNFIFCCDDNNRNIDITICLKSDIVPYAE